MRGLTLSIVLLAVACVDQKEEITEDFSDLAGVDDKSDYFSYRLKLLGRLDAGRYQWTRYTSAPRFRGFSFDGAQGDQVDIWVRSNYGDALAWLVDDRFAVQAKNDDASDATYDAHITHTLPQAGRYYILFRDYDLRSHWFKVSLDKLAGGSWDQAAREQAAAMTYDYTPLEPFRIPVTALPAAARARYDATYAVLETPNTFRLDVQGRPLYLVMATDGSGEGGTVVIDLVDA